VTVQEFATYLRVSVRLVRKWIGAGALPVYIFQGRWRIAKGDALAFVERARLRV
jgi:excisionase family DNA binding protein